MANAATLTAGSALSASVADELRSLLRDHGVMVPDELLGAPDPLDVLRWVGTLRNPDLTRTVETRLYVSGQGAGVRGHGFGGFGMSFETMTCAALMAISALQGRGRGITIAETWD